jgi:hypothetical protein
MYRIVGKAKTGGLPIEGIPHYRSKAEAERVRNTLATKYPNRDYWVEKLDSQLPNAKAVGLVPGATSVR